MSAPLTAYELARIIGAMLRANEIRVDGLEYMPTSTTAADISRAGDESYAVGSVEIQRPNGFTDLYRLTVERVVS